MELVNLDNLQALLEQYAQDVRNLYQDNLISSDRIASGELLNSVEYAVNYNGVQYEVTLTLADYWKYIEYDTKPHFPPLNKILDWIRIKPVIPRPDEQGNIPRPEQLAFLIGRKIAQEGTTGSHDLQSALDTLNLQYRVRLEQAFARDCEGIMKVIFGSIP